METVTIPVVFGALYMINKGSEKTSRKNTSQSQNLVDMQIKALTGTAHIPRKTLSM